MTLHPLMMSATSSMYEDIGGNEAIEAVVSDFYKRVLDDPLLEPYFEETDMDALFAHQVQFVSAVAGGPVDYEGDDMQNAHEGMAITEEAFSHVAGHLADALRANGVSEPHVETIIEEVATLEDDVVGQ
ncbi:group I truncated hemoglobin [Halococcus saccharolyticus]|uniref:Globin n=1 Tax=Halococcus saccharolyticus DSM 5350 TaxID=1227455 RepID=M0ML05_9EURY|nr:globin [Halococcus saccharolyticus DSM 5350]